MSLGLHERDIHIVCRSADDASGADGAAAGDSAAPGRPERVPPPQATGSGPRERHWALLVKRYFST